MRYQNPGMPKVLEEMRQCGYDRVVILPLYAQYASATTGTLEGHAPDLEVVRHPRSADDQPILGR